MLREQTGSATLDTLAEIAEKVRGYLVVRTVLGLISAAPAGLRLFVLDVDLVLVWMVLTFVRNYLPNLGSIVAVAPPAVVQSG